MNDSLDKRTNGYKRRQEAVRKSTDVLLDLLEQAKAYMVPASYLLFDSWFAFNGVIRKVRGDRASHHLHAQVAAHCRYEYQGQKLTLNKLYAAVRKKRGRAKIRLPSCRSSARCQTANSCRPGSCLSGTRTKKKWLALLTTDTDLPEEEVVRIYGKRWNIEVFFKMSKSYLRLAKEFQSRSYDSMMAHTAIVFIRYIMLSLWRAGADRTRGPSATCSTYAATSCRISA